MEKLYYPKLDILKFLCCIGVVTIHTKPFYYYPSIEPVWANIQTLCVPLFFVVSSFLLWGKLSFKNEEDKNVLRHFVGRLVILYFVWTVVMLPVWLPDYIKQNPDMMWLKMLPLKLILGAPNGSWFVVNLIYGTLLCYYVNKRLPMWVGVLLFTAMYLTPYVLRINGIQTQFGIFNLSLSLFIAPLPLQIGYMASRQLLSKYSMGWCKLLIIGILYLILPNDSYLQVICSILMCIFITTYCIRVASNGSPQPILVFMRKMSIIIYFTHFFFAAVAGALYKRGIIDFKFGIPVFLCAIICCSLFAFIVVKLSNRYKIIKYMY